MNNDPDDDSDGISRDDVRRAYETHQGRWLRVGVFLAVIAILYWLYLRWVFAPNPDGDNTITFGGIFLRIFVIALIGGLPFFVMAWLDPVWRSKHAAQVSLGTWLVVFTIFSNSRWGLTCPVAAVFFFIPLTLGALAGHNIGMFRHPETFDQEELDR